MSLTKDSNRFHIFERSYWQYYLELEEQLMRTRRYIAFDEVNFNTYSIEYLKLYQAVCSEIDVVGKEIAFQIDSSLHQQKNIVLNRWWYVVLPEFGDALKNGEVTFYRTYSLSPWKNFETVKSINKRQSVCYVLADSAKTPPWWTAYNKVKHQRTSIDKQSNRIYFTKANLRNVSNAYAALYLLEKSYLSAIAGKGDLETMEISKLFETKVSYFLENVEGEK